jgi:uncharacterized protein
MTIDRLSQAFRPSGQCAMHHHWHDLLFLHWEVSPALLQALLPSALTVDTFEGKAYVGLVPFRISKIRHPAFFPFPGFSQFLEINVRTYVIRNGVDPGVWFFSLDAANPFACIAARIMYKLPYYFAEMSAHKTNSSRDDLMEFRSHRYLSTTGPTVAEVNFNTCGESASAKLGTLDHFLLERYLLYSQQKSKIFVGKVHHTPYQFQCANVVHLKENLIEAAGIRRSAMEPIAHFSPGVSVEIFNIRDANAVAAEQQPTV